MNNLFFFNSFQEVFEINTNIFETNLINLVIVLLILFRFLGAAISSLLNERRETIINALEQSNDKVYFTQTKLVNVQSKLANTQTVIETMYNKRFLSFCEKKELFLLQVEKYTSQLHFFKINIIKNQIQKISTTIYNKVILIIFNKFFTKIISSIKTIDIKRKITNLYVKDFIKLI